MKFLAEPRSPEAESEIDMDMYVQFHGWLLEKRLIHMMMILKKFRGVEFTSSQTRRLLNNQQPIWVRSFFPLDPARNSNFVKRESD